MQLGMVRVCIEIIEPGVITGGGGHVLPPSAARTEWGVAAVWCCSEFEKYQVSVSGSGGGGRRLAPVVRARNDTPACAFDGLEPGAPYTVTVKTMSGKVTSWPAATDLTLSEYMSALRPRLATTPSRTDASQRLSNNVARYFMKCSFPGMRRAFVRQVLPGWFRACSSAAGAASVAFQSRCRCGTWRGATRPTAPSTCGGRRRPPARRTSTRYLRYSTSFFIHTTIIMDTNNITSFQDYTVFYQNHTIRVL